jgi:hypothetical protein
MKSKFYIILIFLITLKSKGLMAQDNQADCLKEILSYDELYNPSKSKDTAKAEPNIFISYSIKTINWEDETTISNIKIHQMGSKMHFFSEQAAIYLDDKNAVIVMPIQKIVVLNSLNEELANNKLNDGFYEMRQKFLDSCKIIKCEIKTNGIKILVLKVDQTKDDNSIMIETMTYEYNPNLKKILSVKVDYNSDYKVKQLTMTYRDFNLTNDYVYYPSSSYVLDRKGNMLEKYKNYEIVDNRDNKPNSKSKNR